VKQQLPTLQSIQLSQQIGNPSVQNANISLLVNKNSLRNMCVTIKLSGQKENKDMLKKKTEDEYIFNNAY
jgi:hypothetical protein